jgi:hypothetical protein
MTLGVERVDEITRLIDEALSGYETQAAGDVWYDDDMAQWVHDDDLDLDPDVTPEIDWPAVQAAARSAMDALPRLFDQIATVISEAMKGLVEFAVANRAAIQAGLHGDKSNNWTDRAVYTWVQAKGRQR